MISDIEVYYRLCVTRVELINQSMYLDSCVSDLLDLVQASGIRSRVAGFFRITSMIKDCQIQMNLLTSISIGARSDIRDCTENINYSQPFEIALYLKQISSEIELMYEHEHRDVILFLEQRRLDRDNKLLLVFSALLGGVVGSILTLIAGK